ncbi:sigma 54-interacting transcriptional regulator [Hyalangium gracile]|uniref:sigma 54-interacting transcriptional regulator n=1 Tax=Hyalangium gracile TaxID=394092 RepID=UPI001CCB29CE|nr:sigma 54-interacting transcriptional regulator [Hyalangium gracile]
MSPDDETLSNRDEESWAPAARPRQFLLVALACEHPLEYPSLHWLDTLDELVLGRGEPRGWSRQEQAGRRRLHLRLPDRWMSKEHARFVRAGAQWMLEDAGSKNGLQVNGEPCARAWLADGDLIELGHTFLLFREAAFAGPALPDDEEPREQHAPVPGFATLNPGLAGELAKLARVARTPVPVVVEGETGTGKELLARAYHRLAGRAGEFVAVNCGALPETLVQSELFGYRKGAFSGANEERPGLVRSADGGTLFLDEIGELPLESQASLLRVLQESEVLPVGGTRPIKVDLRLLAATNRDLEQQVREGSFRSDLLARLSGLRLRLPPLRERREDLGLLVSLLLRRAVPPGAPVPSLTQKAARALFRYDWPRNVRELEHVLALAVALSPERIDLEHLPPELRAEPSKPKPGPTPPEPAPPDAERDRLLALLREHQGNVSRIAQALETSRAQVHRLFKRHGLEPDSFRS